MAWLWFIFTALIFGSCGLIYSGNDFAIVPSVGSTIIASIMIAIEQISIKIKNLGLEGKE